MAFDNSCTNAVSSASPWPTPKRCESQLFLGRTWWNLTSLESSWSWKFKCTVSAWLAKGWKNYCSLNFLPENLEKYCSTELYDAPLEESTIFLYRSSTRRTSLDSSRLAELKYAFFSRTGRNTKQLRCSNIFPLMIFKHGLREGWTFLFQYSSISRTKLESTL